MIEHLEFSYLVAANEIQDFEIATPDKHIEKVAATLYNYQEMPRNYAMPLMKQGALESLKHEDLSTAITHFWEARTRYLDYFKNNPKATTKNPVFGYLDKFEWTLQERKHVNHHFKQFGLL